MEVTATNTVFRSFTLRALVALLLFAFGGAGVAFADEPVTGSVEKDGALYSFEIENGEASIIKIQKAPGNESDTYEALVPAVVGKDGDGWQALAATVPDGETTFLVTSIGDGAAGGRVKLSVSDDTALDYNDQITRIVVPGMVTSIGSNAFAGCRKATQVVFDVDDIPGAEEHVSHLESLGDYAFAGCSSVQAWDLPDSLLRVGTGAFIYGACDSITSLRLPGAPTAWAATRITFSDMPLCTEIVVPEGCVNLPDIRMMQVERIALPSTLRGSVSIMSTEGGKSTSLKELDAAPGCSLDSLKVEFGDVDQAVVPEGVKSLYLRGPFTSVQLPSTLTSITTILASNLQSVQIPASVREIGPYAFAYDAALETVEFAQAGALNTLGNSAFYLCTALVSAELPATVVNMGAHTFQKCDSLAEVVIPASVSVAVAPFKECASLRKVSFAPGSRLVDPQAIAEDCPKLFEVSLPDGALGLNAVADHLVSNCPLLERVYTFNPSLRLTDKMFPDCGTFSVYGWGVDAPLMNSCEEAGIAFVPYAELDDTGYNGAANTTVVAAGPDAVKATCAFSTALSFDYERELAAGWDYTLEPVQREGLAYLRVVGNGTTCFGQTEIPALQDLADASMSAVGVQAISNGRAASPRPRVSLGGRTLVLGSDYTLSYANNDRAGTATVTATGKGNYTGSVSATFAVVERNALSAAAAVSASDAATQRANLGLAASALPGAPQTCTTVVVAWAFDPAAVAVADALAVAQDAQLLVVSNAGGLTPAQKTALAGWGAARAQVVGGADACGSQVVADLKAAGLACDAVTGDGADGVSLAVLAKGSGSWGSTAIVANPSDPAVCLAAAAYAGTVHGPLVFTRADGTLGADALAQLRDFAGVVVAGDFAAVDASIESELADGPNVFRARSVTAADVNAALVAHGKATGVYSSADATYTAPASDASALMPYAAAAARTRAPLTLE